MVELRRRSKKDMPKEEVKSGKRRFDAAAKNSDLKLPSDTSPFIVNLFKAIQEKIYADVICWGESGGQFVIHDMDRFKDQVLKHYFKTTSFSTFIRQVTLFPPYLSCS
jgi:hypothetical protein